MTLQITREIGLFGDRRGKIRAGKRHEALAELSAQHPRRHFLDRALGQIAELKRAERNRG